MRKTFCDACGKEVPGNRLAEIYGKDSCFKKKCMGVLTRRFERQQARWNRF